MLCIPLHEPSVQPRDSRQRPASATQASDGFPRRGVGRVGSIDSVWSVEHARLVEQVVRSS